jgi:hypothetical protein
MLALVGRLEQSFVSGIKSSVKPMEVTMDESVYQARWLLFAVVVVAGGIVGVGVAAGLRLIR